MQHLKNLIAAGYRHGYTNNHGADDTVQRLDASLANLAEDAARALETSEYVAADLEARLFAAYALTALAAIQTGDLEKAKIFRKKVESLSALAVTPYSRFEEPLALIERRLRQSRASAK